MTGKTGRSPPDRLHSDELCGNPPPEGLRRDAETAPRRRRDNAENIGPRVEGAYQTMLSLAIVGVAGAPVVDYAFPRWPLVGLTV